MTRSQLDDYESRGQAYISDNSRYPHHYLQWATHKQTGNAALIVWEIISDSDNADEAG